MDPIEYLRQTEYRKKQRRVNPKVLKQDLRNIKKKKQIFINPDVEP